MDIVNVSGMMDMPGLLMSLNDYLKETQYDEAGRIVERTMGNDVVQTYDYNPWTTQGGRLDTFTTGPVLDPLLSIDYGYDALGNITGLIYNSDNLTESRVYDYDTINRLTGVSIGGTPVENITYNIASGNIQSKDGITYGYASSHPHAVDKLDSVQKYSYDANGRW